MPLPIHPLAEIFPMMGIAELGDLAADIKANGLREPIIVHEGKILDGRNRYAACVEVLGIEPITRPWDGSGDPLDFVISKNMHRRHLDDGQRAVVAERIANLKRGGDRGNQHSGGKVPIGPLPDVAPVTLAEAARMMNVSERSVKRARVVRNSGVAALQKAVEDGEVSVAAAAVVAQQPQDEQMRIIANGPKAVRHAAKAMNSTTTIKVPADMTLEQVCRKGLALEADDPSKPIEDIADQIGISTHSYAAARSILLLDKRDDLTKSDRAIVEAALDDIRGTNQVVRAEEMVRPIAEKFWGTGRTEAKIEKRIEACERAIEVVIGACTALPEIEIPRIPSARAKQRIGDLQEMKGILSSFINRLKERCE